MAAELGESLMSTRSIKDDSDNEETERNDTETDCCISSTRPAGKRHFKYRSRGSVSKGAFLVMASSLALHIAIPYDLSILLLEKIWPNSHIQHAAYLNMYRLLCIVFPLSGLIADSVYGRYKVILWGIVTLVLSSGMMLVAFTLYHVSSANAVKIVTSIIAGLAVILNFVGFAGHDANVIQFLTDQTLGASGEELSGLINLYFGVESFAKLCNILLSKFLFRNGVAITELLIIHLIMSSVTLYCYAMLKQHLDTTPKILNPIKLIFNVLKYAKQNKYPRNRSALTLWEDTKLTRINMAKSKYGGPFTEEQVEDVKTGFRLLPIIALTASVGIFISSKSCTSFSKQEEKKIDRELLTTFVDESLENALLMLLFVPLYHYLIYPTLYRYVPSLLRRIGFGILLMSISLAYLTALDPVRNYIDNENTCIFNSTTTTQVSGLWCFPYTTISAISHLLVVLFGFEFIIAQSPQSMKGLAIGLWFAITGIIDIVCSNMHYLFIRVENSSKFSCGFYLFLTKMLISILLLTLYIIVAKRYTMRIRDNPINVHLIAEDHFIKYMDMSSGSTRTDTDSSDSNSGSSWSS